MSVGAATLLRPPAETSDESGEFVGDQGTSGHDVEDRIQNQTAKVRTNLGTQYPVDSTKPVPSDHVRRTGRASRPCIKLLGRHRRSSGVPASDSFGKRLSSAPNATCASIRARGAPRQ